MTITSEPLPGTIPAPPTAAAGTLAERCRKVRRTAEWLCEGLHPDGEYHPRYGCPFVSHSVQAGERHRRVHRGYLSRPPVWEVYAFRRHVDERVERIPQFTGRRLAREVG
jgi:hypothetical protein